MLIGRTKCNCFEKKEDIVCWEMRTNDCGWRKWLLRAGGYYADANQDANCWRFFITISFGIVRKLLFPPQELSQLNNKWFKNLLLIFLLFQRGPSSRSRDLLWVILILYHICSYILLAFAIKCPGHPFQWLLKTERFGLGKKLQITWIDPHFISVPT